MKIKFLVFLLLGAGILHAQNSMQFFARTTKQDCMYLKRRKSIPSHSKNYMFGLAEVLNRPSRH